MSTIEVPLRLDPETSSGFLNRLERVAFDSDLAIDFSKCEEVTPFGALMMAEPCDFGDSTT
jgi:hypothetical protein